MPGLFFKTLTKVLQNKMGRPLLIYTGDRDFFEDLNFSPRVKTHGQRCLRQAQRADEWRVSYPIVSPQGLWRSHISDRVLIRARFVGETVGTDSPGRPGPQKRTRQNSIIPCCIRSETLVTFSLLRDLG